MRLGAFERFATRNRDLDAKASVAQIRTDGADDRRLVVNEQDAGAGGRAHGVAAVARVPAGLSIGRVKRNTAPPSVRLRTEMRPPCASTRPRATASPSPVPRGVPPDAPRKNGSKTRPSASFGTPGPSSDTSTTASAPATSALITMADPGRVWRA